MAQSNEQSEVVISLHLLANILRKAEDKLNLGPTPKDDRQKNINLGATNTATYSNNNISNTAIANNRTRTSNNNSKYNKHSKVNAKVNTVKLVSDLSRDVGAILHGVLQKFHNDLEVI